MRESVCPSCGSLVPLSKLGSHLLLHSRFHCAVCELEGSADEIALHIGLSGHGADGLFCKELQLAALLLRLQKRSNGFVFRSSLTRRENNSPEPDNTEISAADKSSRIDDSAKAGSKTTNTSLKKRITETETSNDIETKSKCSNGVAYDDPKGQRSDSTTDSKVSIVDTSIFMTEVSPSLEKFVLEHPLPAKDEIDKEITVMELSSSGSETSFQNGSDNRNSDAMKEESADNKEETVDNKKEETDSTEKDATDDDTKDETESIKLPTDCSDVKASNSDVVVCASCNTTITRGVRRKGFKCFINHVLSEAHGSFPRNQLVCRSCTKGFSNLRCFYEHRRKEHTGSSDEPGLLLSPGKVYRQIILSFPNLDPKRHKTQAEFLDGITMDKTSTKAISGSDRIDTERTASKAASASSDKMNDSNDIAIVDASSTIVSNKRKQVDRSLESTLPPAAKKRNIDLEDVFDATIMPSITMQEIPSSKSDSSNDDHITNSGTDRNTPTLIQLPETKSKSSKGGKIPCTRCGAKLASSSASHLFDHIMSGVHGAFSDNPFACRLCAATFRTTSNFRDQHQRKLPACSEAKLRTLLSEGELVKELRYAFPSMDWDAQARVRATIERLVK